MKLKISNYVKLTVVLFVLAGMAIIPSSHAYTTAITNCTYSPSNNSFAAIGTKTGIVSNVYLSFSNSTGSYGPYLIGPPVADFGTTWSASYSLPGSSGPLSLLHATFSSNGHYCYIN